MGYFEKARCGDEVYGTVFGMGWVVTADLQGHYTILIEFENGYQVPYTEDGIPSWGNFDYQTLFYKKDIDIEKMDFSTVNELATPKKIIKWRFNKKLEIKCPSNQWADASKCPDGYIEELLENERFWMFRKRNNDG